MASDIAAVVTRFPLRELEIRQLCIQRMEFLDDVLVLCGAGVGGGSTELGGTDA
jgi:hypothetical protein